MSEKFLPLTVPEQQRSESTLELRGSLGLPLPPPREAPPLLPPREAPPLFEMCFPEKSGRKRTVTRRGRPSLPSPAPPGGKRNSVALINSHLVIACSTSWDSSQNLFQLAEKHGFPKARMAPQHHPSGTRGKEGTKGVLMATLDFCHSCLACNF